MPSQVKQSSFAKHFGQRVAAANEQCQDAPASLGGQQRLPPGVKGGIAKLQVMTVSEYQDDKNGPGTKGKPFFRIDCVAVFPERTESGQRVAGIQTSKMVALCDLPKKGYRDATTFEEGYAEMTRMIKAFGIPPCRETRQSDPTGEKINAYWQAAMQSLLNPAKPRYIKFSTRAWTPNKPIGWKEGDPLPEPMTIENWEGVATDEEVAHMNSRYDPAAGVSEAPPTNGTFTGPDGLPVNDTMPSNEQIHSMSTDTTSDGEEDLNIEAVITDLVAIASNDPDGDTPEGIAAQEKLLKMAWEGGWSEDQTLQATWEEVGDMALNPSDDAKEVTVGSKWKFYPRTKDGAKLKNSKGEEFPPLDVEVLTVKPDGTCTVKNVKDGKTVANAKTRQPAVVKFEWLE